MKQAIDVNGVPIRGLYKKNDGSLVVRDPDGLRKLQTQKNAYKSLNNEVADLKQQLKTILDKLNGVH